MNQCSNKPKKKNLDNDTRKKFCEAAKKRIRTIRENLDDTKRQRNYVKLIRKESKQF